MDARVRFSDDRPRVAVLASKQPHCLADLLGRWRSGELPADIVAVVSNHPDHAALADFRERAVPPPAGRSGDTRSNSEVELLELLTGYEVDLVVLARYMQILGPPVLDAFPTASSTSTTRSCPRSSARARTTRPSSAA